MELKAFNRALREVLKDPYLSKQPFTLYTDSQYVCKGINEWSAKWILKRFRGIKNANLWRKSLLLITLVDVTVKHVRAHQKHCSPLSPEYYNEIADRMAVKARDDGIAKQK